MRLSPLSAVLALGCAAPAKVVTPVVAETSASPMTVAELQKVVARGPFPDDPCQAGWFYAVADTRKAAERLDALVAEPRPCPFPLAKVRLVQLARTDQLSWAAESRAEDTETRLELARFAATSKWEPGTSAVADLVNDADPSVRQAAISAVRALRQSIAVGQLEKSLSLKPARSAEERALLCTALTEFNIDVPPAACRGLQPVPPPTPPEAPGRPAPNLCRTLVTSLASADATVVVRALLELAAPWVQLRLGCDVPNEQLLRLVQFSASPEVRAAAALLALWKHHPADMRRTPAWTTTLVEPEAR